MRRRAAVLRFLSTTSALVLHSLRLRHHAQQSAEASPAPSLNCRSVAEGLGQAIATTPAKASR